MTKKIQIDDAMVERALWKAMWPIHGPADINWKNMRDILEVALNPSDEPEIPVTEEQRLAGWKAFNRRPGSPDVIDCILDAYRAMRKLEPIQANSIVSPFSFGGWLHARRADDVKTVGFMRTHRRKDDPE